MSAHVALLRGINLGGRNSLPMRELVAIFEAAGCTNVRTYIQSGNVVFDARPAIARKLSRAIPKAIADAHGLNVPVVLRTAEELAAVVDNNPFEVRDETHVMFLDERPAADVVAKLDPDRSPGDRFALVGREVFLHCPNGVGRSKLTNDYFDRVLKTTSTARNFRTVMKLVEMTAR